MAEALTVEQQKALALADARRKAAARPGVVGEFGQGANVGISEVAGAPVDLVNLLGGILDMGREAVGIPSTGINVKLPGGSEDVQTLFSKIGLAPKPGEEPDTLPFEIGRFTGSTAAAALPIGAAAKGATAVKATAGPGNALTNFVQDVARTAVKAPGRFIAGEVTAAATAATGGHIARERFPNSPAAETIGALIGGVTPAGAMAAGKLSLTVTGARFARRLVRPFTRTGARGRAEGRVADVTRDPEAAMRGLTADETLPGLTPAQRTGDEGLLSLERSVVESSEQLKGQSDEQIANMTQVIRESLSRVGEGVSPEKTAQAMEQAQGHLRTLLDTRLRIAARTADERIAGLGPNATRADANLIARDELTKALADARAQERDLWRAVPMDAETSTMKAKGAYRRVVKETPRAQQSDIPAVARELLESESNTALGDVDRIRELHGLRSKLLEEARNARAAGQRNKARIAEDISDAILDDLGAAAGNVKGETGESLRAALNYSADLNGRFTRGPVGRLLGTARQGGAATPLELTLERTIGRGGPVGRVEAQALEDAVSRTGNVPALRGAVEDFLKDEFNRVAVRGGEISPSGARVFINKYQDALGDFPDLRRQFDQAIESGNAETVARKRAEGVASRLNDPKVSRSAIFIQHPPEQVIQQIAKVRRPGDAMKEVVKLAQRDTTGDALKGIKTTFTDYLLQQASTRTMTAEGEAIVSGFALRRLLESGPTRQMADALFSPEERRFLQVISNTAEKVEKAVAARPRPEGIIADRPAMLTNVIAGVTGAQIGRKVAEATGGGTVQTPGIMAGIFRRMTANRIQDPARRLLIDAVQDEDLFKALIAKTTDPKQREAARRKLNAWVVGVIRDAGGEESE